MNKDINVEEVIALYRNRVMTGPEICAKYGIPKSTFYWMIKQLYPHGGAKITFDHTHEIVTRCMDKGFDVNMLTSRQKMKMMDEMLGDFTAADHSTAFGIYTGSYSNHCRILREKAGC